jgi:hypothetical protein
VLGALFGGRRSARSIGGAVSAAASRRGVSTRTAQRRRSAEEKAAEAEVDLEELEQELLDEIAEIDEKWREAADAVDTVSIRLEAADVQVERLTLFWAPTA